MVHCWDVDALDRSSAEPLYLQLKARIAGMIEDGALAPGEKLPASRELARKLGVNRNTITSAYEALGHGGHVYSHVGQGTFVSEYKPLQHQAVRWPLSRAVESARELVHLPVRNADHPDPIDFASLVPDETLFPIEPFRLVLDDVLAREGPRLLQYGPAGGYPPLRRYIATRLKDRGVSVHPDRVLVVNGSQQALDLVCRTLLDPGDRVVLEGPTYSILLPLLAQYQTLIDEVPMTDQGMDLDRLEATLLRARPKVLFTMPTFHNPTGITMDLPSRRRLLDIAARNGVPVVEDDFDSELRFNGSSIPPLLALDDQDGVVHIGTFSKGLFPGVRLGWIVAPRDVIAALERSKLISDYHTSLLLQAAVLSFCEQGHYDEHLKRLAHIYRAKSVKLNSALERFCPAGVGWTRPEGGFAFWLSLPDSLSAESLLAESAREGVVFTPGSYFFARGEGRRHLRLSISRVRLDRIEDGIRTLGRIISRRLEQVEKKTNASFGRERGPAVHI